MSACRKKGRKIRPTDLGTTKSELQDIWSGHRLQNESLIFNQSVKCLLPKANVCLVEREYVTAAEQKSVTWGVIASKNLNSHLCPAGVKSKEGDKSPNNNRFSR